ncbi:MAG: hypothetical protein HC820_08535 [Hydrococcus sp. RM1_1_31]|nr:hypothetical protein [Hydrococcus sp. RM1_1_31]
MVRIKHLHRAQSESGCLVLLDNHLEKADEKVRIPEGIHLLFFPAKSPSITASYRDYGY